MDAAKALEYVRKVWADSAEATLAKYIEIPNQSPLFDDEWATNGYQEQAVDLLVEWAKTQGVEGLELEVVKLDGRTPLVYAEVPDTAGKNDTVLLYGHLDKQPPLTEDWDEDLHPHKPVFKDGKLYGRGGADDGYAIFAALTAIRALQLQGRKHARCVVVIEACEESGSFDLPFYIDHLAERIGVPSLVVCLDSGCGNYDQLWLTSSLRGVTVGTLDVKILREGCHSGKSSGIVPDSFRIIRQLLSRVEDENTGEVLLKGLHCNVPEARQQQARDAAAVLGNLITEEFPFVEGAGANQGEHFDLLMNRTWKPALSYTGVDGLPELGRAGNVLRSRTALKLSMRLPPTVDAQTAAEIMKAELERDPPYGAEVSYTIEKAGSGWESPALAPWLEQAVADASLATFEKPHCYTGEGGSIPFMGMLGKRFPKAQFVITGVLGPASNAHGPNEFIHLEMSRRVTAAVAFILDRHANR
eukprot:TRINITY_DN5295_c0_g1_i2.p1 TRINITY_DN5295_c0_g1~~TRINITY_DN5295_c0_g1_i2.p1  ORF type:complete len:472 (-),score=170.01 TRINITY_DN5295_c0_g1_i2:249-1664(-)